MAPPGRDRTREGQESAFDVTPTVLWVSAEEGSHGVDVRAAEAMAWSAVFRPEEGAWASFAGSSRQAGKGRLSLSIEQNHGAPRSGRIAIMCGDETREIPVIQLAPPCWYEELVLSMKLPVLEARALLGMIKRIEQAPPAAHPSMFAALYEGVAALEPSILAIYEGFPEVPQAYTSSFVSHEIKEALAYITAHLPKR